MNKFKAGDRVKCIQGRTDGLVKTGEFYIITGVTKSGCKLKGTGILLDCTFMPTRFVLAPRVKDYYGSFRYR